MTSPHRRRSTSERACALAFAPTIGRALLATDKIRASIGRNAAAVVIILGAAALSIIVSPDARGLLGAALALLMGAIAVSDLHDFIVPNAATAPAFALALVHSIVLDPTMSIEPVAIAALRGLVLALMFLALRAIHWRWRGREGLGLGDVKLAGVAGAWLDWPTIPLAIEVAALAALAAYVLGRISAGRPISATNRMPFGLFLAPAIWLGWVFELVVSELS
jgi:leader peptidase (prepilin peptidase)/N-methyltransferase